MSNTTTIMYGTSVQIPKRLERFSYNLEESQEGWTINVLDETSDVEYDGIYPHYLAEVRGIYNVQMAVEIGQMIVKMLKDDFDQHKQELKERASGA